MKSSQGAIAWGISLVTFPYLALPLYWIFGRSRFRGYRELIREFSAAHQAEVRIIEQSFRASVAATPPLDPLQERVLETLADAEFSGGNELELLVDGEATFDAIFREIDRAEQYVLVQFYIFHDDEVGREFKRRLIARAESGVRVYFLYDEIGSNSLARSYLNELSASGVQVAAFDTRRGRGNFFQLNFRNHRKIVIVDGKVGFVGGLNCGDEYLGRKKRFGFWRDTHLLVRGPAVVQLQATFLADWIWATDSSPGLEWNGAAGNGSKHVLILRTGPADEQERCLLFFLEMISAAKKRIWIASPYFVPDDSITSALQLAALRGVDVRVLLPQKADHRLVWYASFTYLDQIAWSGVRLYRYKKGFLHQKVLVMDEDLAVIGTANLDNRSCRLNFEVMAVVADKEFNQRVAAMLEDDFLESELAGTKDPLSRSWLFKLASRIARLFSPLL